MFGTNCNMPMKNAVKPYVEGGVYHVYNRGVNGAPIFFNEEDFMLFLALLDRYLNPLEKGGSEVKYYGDRVSLFAFSLQNTHLHFLMQQKDKSGMTEIMQSLGISFTVRMNKRHKRVGHLFQGIYRARLIESDEDLMWVSRYIHLNPFDGNIPKVLYWPYSSLDDYVGSSGWSFIDTAYILRLFHNSKDRYMEFICSE
jgi:putative transposase